MDNLLLLKKNGPKYFNPEIKDPFCKDKNKIGLFFVRFAYLINNVIVVK